MKKMLPGEGVSNHCICDSDKHVDYRAYMTYLTERIPWRQMEWENARLGGVEREEITAKFWEREEARVHVFHRSLLIKLSNTQIQYIVHFDKCSRVRAEVFNRLHIKGPETDRYHATSRIEICRRSQREDG